MYSWIKKLGYLQNIKSASESLANQVSHLLIGIFCGFPIYAVSLRVSISFYLSAILELPTGIIADVIGHYRAVAIGYLIGLLACLTLFFSAVDVNSIHSIPLLIISCIFSSIAGSLSSGSFQALLQDYIDLNSYILQNDIYIYIRKNALSISQKYGKSISAFSPPTLILLLFILSKYNKNPEIILLIPAFCYGFLSFYFFKLEKKNIKNSVKKILKQQQ